MSNRFYSPRPQFFSSTPTAYNGAHLKFYISGTSTPKNVYSDAALTTSIGADLTLNSAGWYNGEIFLAEDAAYKCVLEDSAGSVIWTADPVSGSGFATSAQFYTYAGNPNGSVAGTAGTGTVQSDVIWDRTNSILYVCTTSGVAAAAVWTAVNASATTPAVPHPQGRLTMTSATPVLATDVSAGTAVYYALYNGNLVPIYNGTTMVPTEFTELTLTLVASHAASQIYDVFVFSNSGVLTLATGPAWSVATAGSGARGTGAGTTELERVKGLWVNKVQITGRNGSTTYTIAANRATYLGSIFMDGTNGQLTAHTAWGQSRKFGVWNAYNRTPVILKAGDSTASWTYATNTWRPSNNASANSLTIFSGLAEDAYQLVFSGHARVDDSTNDGQMELGIGYNSTSSPSGMTGVFYWSASAAGRSQPTATHIAPPALGINTITALERTANAATTNTYYGSEALMMLSARWMG